MQLENLKILCDLVKSENFSHTAKQNGITQSAVSQKLRAMERYFNAHIIDRSHKKFRLTDTGEVIYKFAATTLFEHESLKNKLLEMEDTMSGTVYVSTVYSIGLHELPPFVKQFLKTFPKVNVRVKYRQASQVYADVLDNTADLGFVAFPAQAQGLKSTVFETDKLVVICSKEHPFSNQKSVKASKLTDEPVIGFNNAMPTRQATDTLLKERGVQIEPYMICDNIEIVKRAVEIDTGVAIVPENTVQQEIQQGLLHKLDIQGPDYPRPLAILQREDKTLSPAMQAFRKLIVGDKR